jgi:hypothetical protein
MTPVTAAALVAAGLVSVVAFPLLALGILRGEMKDQSSTPATPTLLTIP